jgi:hypothetical protein
VGRVTHKNAENSNWTFARSIRTQNSELGIQQISEKILLIPVFLVLNSGSLQNFSS